jgi:hypothetical protein
MILFCFHFFLGVCARDMVFQSRENYDIFVLGLDLLINRMHLSHIDTEKWFQFICISETFYTVQMSNLQL